MFFYMKKIIKKNIFLFYYFKIIYILINIPNPNNIFKKYNFEKLKIKKLN